MTAIPLMKGTFIKLGRGAMCVAVMASAIAVGSPAEAGTLYGQPSLRCRITDSRLPEISGMAIANGRLQVINDNAPAVVYRLTETCGVAAAVRLPIWVRDSEDLARASDDALWIADIGDNAHRRSSVSVYRWPAPGTVKRYDLVYPDGPHDAEALMISHTGQLVIVTKSGNGTGQVYSARLPLAAITRLSRGDEFRVQDFSSYANLGAGSLAITGAAVSPDGAHFLLRTYTSAYEWDAPDRDIVRALRTRQPRRITLADTAQSEAITYSASGSHLLTTSEQLPAPLHAVHIYRS